jgi:uncharacterized protein with GYD domain
MTRYLVLIEFTEQGLKNVKKSTARAAAFKQVASKAGVEIEAQYWTVGAYDGFVVLRAEQESNLLRAVAALAAEGNVRTQSLRAMDEKEFEAVAGR